MLLVILFPGTCQSRGEKIASTRGGTWKGPGPEERSGRMDLKETLKSSTVDAIYEDESLQA